jgi:GNAT superfamily N-acetyltransferase
VRAVVREDVRGRGLGGALWTRAEDYATSLRPRLLQTFADDDPASLAFVERRGYEAGRKRIIWELALRHAELPGANVPPGIRIAPLREFRDRPRELFELYQVAEQDLPGDTRYGQLAYEEWLPETLEHPDLDWDASVVALDGGRPASFTFLHSDRSTRAADIEMTGTRPGLRGRGLARLVKVDSLRRAADFGIERAVTANDAENAPMLAINRAVGFQQVKVLTGYEREPLSEAPRP